MAAKCRLTFAFLPAAPFQASPTLLRPTQTPLRWRLPSRPGRNVTRPAPFAAVAPPPPPPTVAPRPRTSASPSATAPNAPDPPAPPLWPYAWPRLLLLAVAAIWGTNFATVKWVQTGADAVPLATAALARFGLAAAVMAPLACQEHARRRAPVDWCFLPDAACIGLAVTAGYFSQALSLVSTDANKSAFMCSLAVIFVPLLERLARAVGLDRDAKEQDPGSFISWGAPLLAVLGVGLLELGGASGPTQGDLWALLQAVAFAFGFIGNGRAAVKYPGLCLSITAVQLGVVAASSLAWAVADASLASHTFVLPDIRPAFASTSNLIAVAYAGVITTAITVWMENIALTRVSPAELAILLSTEPFWAAAFSAVLLGERMGPQALAGGGLILLACLLDQSKKIDFASAVRKRGSNLVRFSPFFAFLEVLMDNGVDPPTS